MIKKMIFTVSVLFIFLLSGCVNDQEIEKLKSENETLKEQIAALEEKNSSLEDKIAMYVPKEQTTNNEQSNNEQPVKLASINIGPDAGGASVDVTLQNTSSKTIDAVDFVVLQFDNFGRPSNRFNDPKYGNVTSTLTLQGNTAPGDTLRGGWTLFNMEKSQKAKVVIQQVHFTDGAVWVNRNFESDVEKEKGEY